MRPIKFRAWSLKWGMVYSDTPGFSIDVHARTVWKDCADDENVELMQFTGLLDSQGVEIYEGDIVRSGMTGADYIIFWSEENSAWHKQTIGINVKDRPIYSDANSRVIGNIHQNPELLK